MVDPRLAVLEDRLASCRRIVAVTGGKGGIGKSFVASTLALVLARSGRRTGLLDLDFTGPCDHLFLGAAEAYPTEEWGIEPPDVAGVRFLTVASFVKDRPAPLRGPDVTSAFVELLAVTRWGELDVLVVDMPPGIGDALLDAVRILRRAEYLVVANPSKVVVETVRRTVRLLAELRAPIVGVLENMARGDDATVRALARECGVRYLGAVPWDAALEAAIGDPDALVRTDAASALRAVLDGAA